MKLTHDDNDDIEQHRHSIVGQRKCESEKVESCYIDLSLIYPVNPRQLPKELGGVEWPREEG
jgi:hypothetical protein